MRVLEFQTARSCCGSTIRSGIARSRLSCGPIIDTLRRVRGVKASYLLAEDNDPTGIKSGKTVAEKKRLHIKTIPWPRYSPDMMPLDFCPWDDINKRMDAIAPAGAESATAFKPRLRRVALRTSSITVRAAVEAMRMRAKAISEAKGKDIARD